MTTSPQPSEHTPSSPSVVRLLPFGGPEGKRAHLITDGSATLLALLADNIEEQQIQAAAALVTLTRTVLEGEGKPDADALRMFLERLVECTTNVLNICESRGQRIPPYEGEESEE